MAFLILSLVCDSVVTQVILAAVTPLGIEKPVAVTPLLVSEKHTNFVTVFDVLEGANTTAIIVHTKQK